MISKTAIRNSVLVFLILVAVLVYALVFALTNASAQAHAPASVGDLMPVGVYTDTGRVLPLGVVEQLRAVPAVAVAGVDYNRTPSTWTLNGAPIRVEWEHVYAVDFRDGGTAIDAYLVAGWTARPDLMLVTVAYAARGWHCQGAVFVARVDFEEAIQ